MEFLTRTAHTADAEFITELSDQLGYKTTHEKIRKRMDVLLEDPHHCVFVVCNRAIVVGWIHAFYCIRIESDPFIEIGGLVIEKHYRKKGLGKMLIRKVIEWAAMKNITRIRVRSNTIRKETHEFYRNIGFKEIKEQKIFDMELG